MLLSKEDESVLKWECTLFFQNNPYTMETATGIATRIGRDEQLTRKTLNQLVEVHVLETIGDSESVNPIYRYRKPFVAKQIDLG